MRCIQAITVLATLAALAACDNNENEAGTPARDVQYFLDYPDERKATLEECRNNPGELDDTENCRSASTAERDAFINAAQDALKTSN